MHSTGQKQKNCTKLPETMWVKSNPKEEENGVTPLRHIPAQPTREIGGLQQPRPCRLNYFPKARGTKG